MRNCGPSNNLVPVFEAASDGPYAFLTTGKFLSSAPGGGTGGDVLASPSTRAIRAPNELKALEYQDRGRPQSIALWSVVCNTHNLCAYGLNAFATV